MPRAETADTLLFTSLPCSRFALSDLPWGVLSFGVFNMCRKTPGSVTCFSHVDGKILTSTFPDCFRLNFSVFNNAARRAGGLNTF